MAQVKMLKTIFSQGETYINESIVDVSDVFLKKFKEGEHYEVLDQDTKSKSKQETKE